MICRLFEFEVDTCRKKSDNILTTKDCEHCKDSVCKSCQDVSIKKGKQKFGWHISRILTFPEGYSGGLTVGLKFYHPGNNAFWVCKFITKDGDEQFKLMLTHKASVKICDNLKQLNYQLIKTINYDGLPVCAEDWL